MPICRRPKGRPSKDRVTKNLGNGKIGTPWPGDISSPEQKQWLDRIREHLRTNLSIGRDDFEELPVFNRYGGWGRVSKVFGPELPKLIKQLNQAIAA